MKYDSLVICVTVPVSLDKWGRQTKMGILKGKRTTTTMSSSIFRFFYAQTRKKKRSIAINEIALLRRIDPFPQSPSCSVLPMGFCFRLIVYVAILFYWPWRCPKEIALILIHFVFLANSKGLGIWPVYLPRRRKVNITEKKVYRGAPLFIHRKKKKSYTESLSYSSCCYKMQGKSPWRKDGLGQFTVRSIVHQCRKLMAALCPTQETEIKPALGLLFLFKLLSPRLQLWSLVDPIAWGFPSQLTA